MATRRTQRGRERAAAAVLLGGLCLAAPAAAQGVIATGRGRAGATVALVVVLTGLITGGVALRRSARRTGIGQGRDGAIVALVLGVVGMVLAGLHLATTTGAFYGAGNGRAGAILALVLGGIGLLLGRRALVRSSEMGDWPDG